MISYGFYNILKIQRSVLAERSSIDINIYNLTSSLKITAFRLKGTKFIFRKPTYIFSLPKIAKNIV